MIPIRPAARRIRPDRLHSYLERHGWEALATTQTGATQWTRGGFHALVPSNPELEDYGWLVERAIHALALAEDRTGDAVIADVDSEGADVLRVAAVGPALEESLTLPLRDGRLLLEALDGFIISAAGEVAVRAGLPASAVSRAQEAFRDRVELGRTEHRQLRSALNAAHTAAHPAARG